MVMLGFVMKKNEWWKVMNMFARSVMREKVITEQETAIQVDIEVCS